MHGPKEESTLPLTLDHRDLKQFRVEYRQKRPEAASPFHPNTVKRTIDQLEHAQN